MDTNIFNIISPSDPDDIRQQIRAIRAQWDQVEKLLITTAQTDIATRIKLLEQQEILKQRVESLSEGLEFATERMFEKSIVIPMINFWGFISIPQYHCRINWGTRILDGIVDVYVLDEGRHPVTLFENKREIKNISQREDARLQAQSYALFLGLSCFVIAAPEGLWVYSLQKNTSKEEAEFKLDKSIKILKQIAPEIKKKIVSFQ